MMLDLLTVIALASILVGLAGFWFFYRNGLKAKLLLTAGVLVGALIMLAVWFVLEFQKADDEVNLVMTAYMQDLASGNLGDAYAFAAKDLRETVSLEDFKERFGSSGEKISGFLFLTSTSKYFSVTIPGPRAFQYSGLASFRDRSRAELSAVLVKESGRWLISEFEISR